MCGIVAGVELPQGAGNIVPCLIEGLKKLEYRGYDSAGLAIINTQGQIERARCAGRVSALEAQTAPWRAHIGIAHTRWATHGVPSERNAHPHMSGGLALVHNGIIENYATLRETLEKCGYSFTSDTDSEVIAHLLDQALNDEPDLLRAMLGVRRRLQGAYAIAVLQQSQPDRLVLAREGAPLLLGISDEGCYAASDASALLQVTRRMVYLENGDTAQISPQGWQVIDSQGQAASRPIVLSQLSADAVELGRFRHYMQKEIFEQPDALANTLEMLGTARSIQPGLFGAQAEAQLADVDSVLIIACGTSYHAGLTARYWMESLAGLPCQVEVASELRYRTLLPRPQQLLVAVSQSGETADTLAALQALQAIGQHRTLALCNVPESAIVRAAALRFITRAGPEIGVASTKAFTTQLAALFLLALTLAKQRGRLGPDEEAGHLNALRHLPQAAQQVLSLEPQIKNWAQMLANKGHALFLGRGYHYPIALEGALKLKEISYIHAEGYAAGELKHGPLALVDSQMPVFSIAPNDALLGKLQSNLQEVCARGGQLYVFADADSAFVETPDVHVLRLPEHYGALSPVLHVIPLQLLAYHAALVKGTDVDKPRNLAKSVTVE
jgi:glucosamine--fructose-6-phosphate aminotransferase (isomerizing)